MDSKNPLLKGVAFMGSALITTISIIFIFLNFSAGIIGGIWLAFLGEWGSILLGLGLAFFMPTCFTFVSLPALGFGFLVSLFAEKENRVLTSIFGLLSSLYSQAIVAVWVIYVFFVFMTQSDSSSYIPYLLWSYSTITGPLAYMANKEGPDSFGTTLGIFFALITFFICVFFYFLGESPLPWFYSIVSIGVAFSIFAVVMGIASMVQEQKSKKARKDYENINIAYDDEEDWNEVEEDIDEGSKIEKRIVSSSEAGKQLWQMVKENSNYGISFEHTPDDLKYLTDYEGVYWNEIEKVYLWSVCRGLPDKYHKVVSFLNENYLIEHSESDRGDTRISLEKRFKEYDELWFADGPEKKPALSSQMLANIYNGGKMDEGFQDMRAVEWIYIKYFNMMMSSLIFTTDNKIED